MHLNILIATIYYFWICCHLRTMSATALLQTHTGLSLTIVLFTRVLWRMSGESPPDFALTCTFTQEIFQMDLHGSGGWAEQVMTFK